MKIYSIEHGIKETRGNQHGYLLRDYARDLVAEINKAIWDQGITDNRWRVEQLLDEMAGKKLIKEYKLSIVSEDFEPEQDKFDEIGFIGIDHEPATSPAYDLREYLREKFNGDYQAMLDCRADFQQKLEDGDTETENGSHPWILIESDLHKIAFGESEWHPLDKDQHLELQFPK